MISMTVSQTPTDGILCKSPSLRPLKEERSCVAVCSEGRVEANGECICIPPLIRNGQGCITACPSGTSAFPVAATEKNRICLPTAPAAGSCPLPRVINTSYNVCECPDGKNFDGNTGSCVDACPQGRTAEGGVCVCIKFDNPTEKGSCIDTCPAATPVSNGKTCLTACPTPLFRDGNTCVAACPALTVVATRTCADVCVATALRDRLTDTCVAACPTGSVAIPGQKECICPVGQHLTVARVCAQACTANSTSDQTTRVCKCNDGFLIHRGECVAACPQGFFKNFTGTACTKSCAAGEVLDTFAGQCKKSCGDDGSKLPVNGVCSCPEGKKTKRDGKCDVSCPDEDFTDGDFCVQKCPDTKIANDFNECVCKRGFSLEPNSNVCLRSEPGNGWGQGFKQCMDGWYNDGSFSKCKPCPPGTYSKGKDKNFCIPCEKDHACFWINNELIIRNCKILGGKPNLGSTDCITNCPNGKTFDRETNNCISCNNNLFSNRATFGLCLRCRDGYKAIQSAKCVKCPPGSYSDSSSDGCVECPSHYRLSKDQTECSPCPENQDAQNGENICNDCAAPGKSNDSNDYKCTSPPNVPT